MIEENSCKLPVPVAIYSDELAVSFASRVAKANGFQSLSDFCGMSGLNRLRLRAGHERDTLQLGSWTGVEPNRLAQFSFRSGKHVPFGNAKVSRFRLATTGIRYCAMCLAEDREKQSEELPARAYLRASWHWNAVTHCPCHGTSIVHDRTGGGYDDDIAALMDRRPPKAEFSPILEKALSCDQYFASRIAGPHLRNFLDRFPAYVAAELCEVLGTLELRNGNDIAADLNDAALRFQARKIGFDIASGGFDAVESFMTEHVQRKVRSVWEHRQIYAPIWVWLRYLVEDDDYSELVSFFQHHAESQIPFAKGEVFLKQVETRTLHTLKSAAREYGISESRVETLLKAASLPLPSSERTPFLARSVIDPVLSGEQVFVTSREAAEILGCNLAVLNELLDKGVLEHKVNNVASPRQFRLVARPEIQRFLDVTMKGVKTAPEHLLGLIPLRNAAARCHCQVAQIIDLICRGKLRRFGTMGSNRQLTGLLVDPVEVQKLVMLSESEGLIDMRGVERRLRTTTATVSELVKRELLPTVVRRHPTKRTPQTFVEPSAVDQFLGKYVSLSILARERHYQIAFLRDVIEEKGIRPIFEPKGKVARFYRKTEIAGIV